MTTLKAYYADEIALALDAQLKDEGFVGLYKKAEVSWWDKSPTASTFKKEIDAAKTAQEVDAVQNKYLAGGDLTTKLGQEGVDDYAPLRNYADAKAGSMETAAADGCTQHAETQKGCPECADASVAIAVDFAIRHVTKVADALDKAGFAGIAEALDDTLRKLAAQRPIVALAEKKKTRGRSYKEWVTFFGKKGPKVKEKFTKTFKGALGHAKEKGMKADKAEEYAMRTALDKMPKSYFKELGKEHGPGKSGPKVTKKAVAPTAAKPADVTVRETKKDKYEVDPVTIIGKVPKKSPWVRNPQIKQLQQALLLLMGQNPTAVGPRGPDGVFGPQTADMWNAFTISFPQFGGQRVNVRRNPKDVPSDDEMNKIIGLSNMKPEMRLEYLGGPVQGPYTTKPTAPTAPVAPAVPAAKKPVRQVTDAEEPPPVGETARQQELRRRFPGVVGYDPNKR